MESGFHNLFDEMTEWTVGQWPKALLVLEQLHDPYPGLLLRLSPVERTKSAKSIQ